MNILSWLKNLFSKKKEIAPEKSESFGGSLLEKPTGSVPELPTIKTATADVFDELNKLRDEFKNDLTETKEAFRKLEEKWNRISDFMMCLTILIAGVFAVTSLLIALDYFKYNQDRYEECMNETKKVQKEFKDCIWNNGLYSCLK